MKKKLVALILCSAMTVPSLTGIYAADLIAADVQYSEEMTSASESAEFYTTEEPDAYPDSAEIVVQDAGTENTDGTTEELPVAAPEGETTDESVDYAEIVEGNPEVFEEASEGENTDIEENMEAAVIEDTSEVEEAVAEESDFAEGFIDEAFFETEEVEPEVLNAVESVFVPEEAWIITSAGFQLDKSKVLTSFSLAASEEYQEEVTAETLEAAVLYKNVVVKVTTVFKDNTSTPEYTYSFDANGYLQTGVAKGNNYYYGKDASFTGSVTSGNMTPLNSNIGARAVSSYRWTGTAFEYYDANGNKAAVESGPGYDSATKRSKIAVYVNGKKVQDT
ncbi:MAG: hypothetical protein HUJ72_12230, partial [Blautia sp.]|nr:hypothetical protein [Blautia sp.]